MQLLAPKRAAMSAYGTKRTNSMGAVMSASDPRETWPHLLTQGRASQQPFVEVPALVHANGCASLSNSLSSLQAKDPV